MSSATRKRSTALSALAAAVALFFQGCGAKPPPGLSDGEKNLQALGNAIAMYQSAKRAYPPSFQELKSWLKTAKASDLKARGIDDTEKIFVSPRDNEPYVYIKPVSEVPPVLAHEKTGAGGKKMSVGHLLIVEEVEEADLTARIKESRSKTPREP
jgi:hypothetical protein